MKKIYLVLLFLPYLISCEEAVDPEVKALQDRQAAFASFSPAFEAMAIDTLTAFACETATYGPHLSEPFSDVLISDSLIQASFSADLLDQAGFMRTDESGNSSFAVDNEYYALGRFPYSAGYDAYLIGAFENESMYSTHLFLYGKNAGDFTYTHTLNFLMEGGAFSSSRQAWLYDFDGDNIRDVVYMINVKADNEMGERESFITDSMRAEVWTGNGFSVKRIEDTYGLRATLNGEEGESGESTGGDISEFF